MRGFRNKSGWLGVFAVCLFLISLFVFGNLNSDFNFFEDLISKLGSKGAPNAIWWNIIGFGIVGLAFFGFGISFGKFIKDKLAGILLSFFGLGFAFTSIPIDLIQPESPNSKVHIAAITIALAFWLLGLAKISSNVLLGPYTRYQANVAAVLIVSAMLGSLFFSWPMSITQRLIFMIVFIWTSITSIGLLLSNQQIK